MDDLHAVLGEARRELAGAEARLSQLFDRAAEAVARAEQEQAELQRFLEEFGLDATLSGLPATRQQGGTSPLLDVEAMRSGVRELTAQFQRAAALRGNLANAVQMLQLAQDQLAEERAFRSMQETADVRLQQAMNAAREDERRRLAREIHDGPAQVLTNSIYGVQIAEQVARRDPTGVAEELGRVRQLLKEGVDEIRRFMFNLRPTMLQDQGLAPTLRRHVDDYRSFFARRVDLRIAEPLPPLTDDQELTIFRIVQEALHNVHKHAGPEAEARVELTYDESHLRLSISDTGKGFDPGTVAARSGAGAGLPGMRERAKLIGADLAIASVAGSGTRIDLKMRLRGQTGLLGGTAPLRSA